MGLALRKVDQFIVAKQSPDKVSRETAFAKRLDQAMNRHPDCPGAYGRYTWIVNRLQDHQIKVTIETVRKWVNAVSMPRRDKMAALAKILRVDETWLAMGTKPAVNENDRVKDLKSGLEKILASNDVQEIHRIARKFV